MPVYVDDMKAQFRYRGRVYIMSHMMADTLAELHTMADTIGLPRKYLQDVPSGVHYDITQAKRALAITAGAIQISMREMAAYAWYRRTRGVNIDPVAALSILQTMGRQG
jgi:hypothetical protein